jgi:opacity protein-like surface antigen
MSQAVSRIGWIVLLFAAVLLAPSAALAGKRSGNVHFFVGAKLLDSNDWGDLDDHSAFGAEMSWGNTDWPISIATDLFVSATVDTRPTDFELVGGTIELDLGVRKIFELGRTRPYVGGGIAFGTGIIAFDCIVGTFSDCVDEEDSGSGVGAWLNAGVAWRLGKRFELGLSTRWSTVNADGIYLQDRDAGGFQYGLLIGWGWPEYP